MTELTMLGMLCVGLAVYCLHLHKQVHRSHRAGLRLTELLVRYIMRKEDCSMPEAAKHLHLMQFEDMVNKVKEM